MGAVGGSDYLSVCLVFECDFVFVFVFGVVVVVVGVVIVIVEDADLGFGRVDSYVCVLFFCLVC